MLGLPLWPVFAATVLLVLLLVLTAVETGLKILRTRP
jgi:hypothetical protein